MNNTVRSTLLKTSVLQGNDILYEPKRKTRMLCVTGNCMRKSPSTKHILYLYLLLNKYQNTYEKVW